MSPDALELRDITVTFRSAEEREQRYTAVARTTLRVGAGVGRLILVPALLTLAVTILRLVGELSRWSSSSLSPASSRL